MAKKITKRKRKRQKQARINFCIDALLSFFVIILPLIAIILYAFGVDIPKIVLGIYTSVVFIAAGVLFITFTALEKFGFGKAGVYLCIFKHLVIILFIRYNPMHPTRQQKSLNLSDINGKEIVRSAFPLSHVSKYYL